jgi:hypothetical protein
LAGQQDQPVQRPGHGHIQQPGILGRLDLRIGQLAKAGDHHQRKFQPLAGMHAHQLDRIAAGKQGVALLRAQARSQRNLRPLQRRFQPLGLVIGAIEHCHF